MLKKIKLENYKCYKDSQINIKDLVIIVGKNNVGKSTLIEALRIISLAAKMCVHTSYKEAPKTLKLAKNIRGFRVPVERLKIDLRGAIYYYGDEIAKITAYFDNQVKIVVYVNAEIAFATIEGLNNEIIKSTKKASELNISDKIGILPQIGLIKENEKLLSYDTVTKDVDTYLSSRHFRNEIYLYKDKFFEDFKNMSEETWPGLRIKDLEKDVISSENMTLFIQDDRFLAEIGLMGSGIQMWLQIIWFICRSKNCETIILDEPDVYMHPDMQLKILKIVTQLFKQVIIATHSIEIISNVSHKNIVTVDKKSRKMSYAGDLEAVQEIVDDIGSMYNLSLINLNNSNKCIFVEGNDMKMLQQFYDICHPKSTYSLESIPCLPLGGFKRLNEAFGASKLFFENSKGIFKCYAILDSDYYSEEQKERQKVKAIENHLKLHIWRRKELENYIIIPNVLFRITEQPKKEYTNFLTKFERFVDTFKKDVISAYTDVIFDEYRQQKESISPSKATAEAEKYVNSAWKTLDDKLRIVPGKKLLKATNGWINKNYKKHCSKNIIFKAMTVEDLDDEIIEILDELTI